MRSIARYVARHECRCRRFPRARQVVVAWVVSIPDGETVVRQLSRRTAAFPGQNFTGKFTYQPSNNNKFIGYFQRTEKLQINRLDGFRLSAPRPSTCRATQPGYQDYHSGVWKGEYNRVMGNNAFAEVRGGGYWFHFPTERQTEALRYEDPACTYVAATRTACRIAIVRRCSAPSAISRTTGWARTT